MRSYIGIGSRERPLHVNRPDGGWLDPEPSQLLINHSPDGFAWGYGGSGPAQLALAILLDHTQSSEVATKHYQEFKWKFMSGLPMGGDWELPVEEIEKWLELKDTS